MYIQCPHCGADGNVPDEKAARASKLVCPKCKEPFPAPGRSASGQTSVEANEAQPLKMKDTAQTDNADSTSQESRVQQSKSWAQRHLALLVFLGTLFGSLLGAFGSLSEALNLLVPIWKFIHPSPEIRVVGSNTILGSRLQMADKWVADFQDLTKWQEPIPFVGKRYRQFEINIDAIGSLAGIQEVEEGRRDVHVLATSEPIPDEAAKQITNSGVSFHCAAEIGYDLVVFVTDKNNPVPILKKADITRILTGEITDWTDLGAARDAKPKPIVIFARKGSGTTDVILQSFTDPSGFPAHFVECVSNADCLNQAVGTPGSLYWVSLSWLYTQPPDYMQVILIQDAENTPPSNPYEEDFNANWYPTELLRPLYMYVLQSEKSDPAELAVSEEFFSYVRGVRGQKILEQSHFYTYFDPPTDMHLHLPSGFGRGHGKAQVVCH
jgi:predicted Zn finger-like uncharacterized protein